MILAFLSRSYGKKTVSSFFLGHPVGLDSSLWFKDLTRCLELSLELPISVVQLQQSSRILWLGLSSPKVHGARGHTGDNRIRRRKYGRPGVDIYKTKTCLTFITRLNLDLWYWYVQVKWHFYISSIMMSKVQVST